MRCSERMRIVACVVALCGFSAAFAQPAEAPEPAAEAPAETVTRTSEQRGLDTLISLTIPRMDLTQALQLVAQEAGVNVAMGENVKGTVSCNLNNVTARSVIQSFLSANGFAFIEQEGILVVVRAEKPGKEKDKPPPPPPPKMVRKLFKIPYTGKEADIAPSSGGIAQAATGSYASASGERGTVEVAGVIRNMLSDNGTMAYYERQHMILVRDTEEVVALVEEFVKALWAMPIQVFIDSKLVEITLQSGEAMGINWTLFQKVGESGPGVNLGVGSSGTAHPGTSVVSTGTDNAALPNVNPFTFGVVNAHIEAVARALKSRERVDLQSNPRLLVMNHRKATIIVGQEIPYLSSTESGTANPVNTYEFKEVAIRMEVTPHVSDDGRIFMDVHPQVKNLIGYQGAPPQPVLSTREAVTYVAVGDNETLLIGGLVQRGINKTRWQVPWIARIPLIGVLFRQKQDTDSKTDLVFLLNPRLVKPSLMESEMKAKERLLREPLRHEGELELDYPKQPILPVR